MYAFPKIGAYIARRLAPSLCPPRHRRRTFNADRAEVRAGPHLRSGAHPVRRSRTPRVPGAALAEFPLHGHAITDWATRRRCQWAGWSHPVPQPTARQSLHAPKHVWLIHRVCVTRALGSRAQVEAAAVFGAPAVLLGLQGRLWCALCTGCAQEALRQRLR